MPRETLRVLPRGTAMVSHYEVQGVVRKFHGWKHDPNAGDEYEDPKTGAKTKLGAFVKLEAASADDVILVPMCAEYLRHLRDGDLWAADQATATAAHVKFDPSFGGEHPMGASKKPEKPAEKAPEKAEAK